MIRVFNCSRTVFSSALSSIFSKFGNMRINALKRLYILCSDVTTNESFLTKGLMKFEMISQSLTSRCNLVILMVCSCSLLVRMMFSISMLSTWKSMSWSPFCVRRKLFATSLFDKRTFLSTSESSWKLILAVRSIWKGSKFVKEFSFKTLRAFCLNRNVSKL
jgi:hypothetical protein